MVERKAAGEVRESSSTARGAPYYKLSGLTVYSTRLPAHYSSDDWRSPQLTHKNVFLI